MMETILNALITLLKANLTGYKTIRVGDPTISNFYYPRPAVLISPLQTNVSADNVMTYLNKQDYQIQIFVMTQDYPVNNDREGILKGAELAKEVNDVLEANRKLSGVVDGKCMDYLIEDGYFMATNQNVFSATPRITATYYIYEERDLQPSGL